MFGIEFDPEEAEKARVYCDTVLTADADALPASAFSDGFFDVIVYADVLEHMKYPECVLSMQQRWLSSDGYAIVGMSSDCPLSANDDVLEHTRKDCMRTIEFNSSSERPSLKYSLSISPLILTKGRTAID